MRLSRFWWTHYQLNRDTPGAPSFSESRLLLVQVPPSKPRVGNGLGIDDNGSLQGNVSAKVASRPSSRRSSTSTSVLSNPAGAWESTACRLLGGQQVHPELRCARSNSFTPDTDGFDLGRITMNSLLSPFRFRMNGPVVDDRPSARTSVASRECKAAALRTAANSAKA
jgi:hypothetical protein